MTRTEQKPIVDGIPSFEREEDFAAFLETHELSEKFYKDAGRGEGADPELDAILARKPAAVARPSSKPLRLEKKVREALNRQAEKQGTTPDELVNEVLKKALKVP